MKKLIALILTLLLCFACTLTSFADAWIPPIDDGGYCEALTQLPGSSDAEALNRFVSETLHEKQEESNVFAYAEWCEYVGSSEYVLWFKLFKTTDDPEACYALSDPEAAENVEEVGGCQAQLKYLGDTEATQFDVSDFTLTFLRKYDESGDYTVLYSEAEIQEVTETEEITEIVVDTETVTEADTASETAENIEPTVTETNGSGFWTTDKIIITAAVGAAVVAAAIAIALIFRKKR